MAQAEGNRAVGAERRTGILESEVVDGLPHLGGTGSGIQSLQGRVTLDHDVTAGTGRSAAVSCKHREGTGIIGDATIKNQRGIVAGEVDVLSVQHEGVRAGRDTRPDSKGTLMNINRAAQSRVAHRTDDQGARTELGEASRSGQLRVNSTGDAGRVVDKGFGTEIDGHRGDRGLRSGNRGIA